MIKKLAVTTTVVLIGALVAWAGSWQGETIQGIPLFAAAVACAFLIQWLVYIPSQIFDTESFFDLTGSLTYVGISLTLLLVIPDKSPRAVVLGILVVIWALRLGTFLFLRIKRAGSDSRFDEIKKSPLRFFNVWTIQGLWITMTASAAWIAMTSDQQQPPGVLFYLGVIIWAAGFVIEVAADFQKSRFRSRAENKGRFITSGLWAWSQHPNYFGEIAMWVGIAVAASANLRGWQFIGLLSPIFVIVLLTKVSGIPLLQKQAETKWGDDPEYVAYRERTSLLVPLPPR